VVRHVQDGTPLGVRVIDAERKLVGLLLTEALTNASGFPAADLEEASRPVRSARREPSP
jgi:Mg-chelatase subunit ChlD